MKVRMKTTMKKGIDVSYANSSIDWAAAKSDIDFAIIRSSFGSDLPSQIDSFFYQNANGCVRNNIPFGTYHFAYFISVEKAKEEAAFAIRLANEYKEYVKFIALDIEEDSVRYAKAVGANPNYTDCAIAFCEKVKEAGYIPVIYTNQSWITNVFDWEKLKKYKLWYAAPGSSAPKYPCALWQYSWNGHFAGSRFDTDMDYCYDDSLFDNTLNSSPTPEGTENNSTEKINQLSSSQPVNYTVQITARDGVNMRTGAGTNYKIIGGIPYMSQVHISRRTSGGGYTWGLALYNNTIGWIALDYTKIAKQKSVDELANEVIRGDWGAGDERKNRLTAAGYDYANVQKNVSKILGQ